MICITVFVELSLGGTMGAVLMYFSPEYCKTIWLCLLVGVLWVGVGAVGVFVVLLILIILYNALIRSRKTVTRLVHLLPLTPSLAAIAVV